jgi:hypothetical protein
MVAIKPGELVGGQYNSGGVLLADAQTATLQVTSGGSLIVSTSGSGPGGATPVIGATATGWTTSQVAVSNTAVLLLAANALREGAIVVNGGSATVYRGKTNTVTSATGALLLPNTAFSIDIPNYRGDIYGICASGTSATVSVEEFTP